MQRVNDLWPQITFLENLSRAAYQVLRVKRDQVRAGDFFFALEHQLVHLQQELRTQTYLSGSYRTF